MFKVNGCLILKRAPYRFFLYSIKYCIMSKSVPINNISTVEEDDDQTIQDVLQSLDVDLDMDTTATTNSTGSIGTNSNITQNYQEPVELANNISNNYSPLTQTPVSPENISFISSINDDIINLVVVFVLFIIVSKLPIENLIYRYISIQHIPLSQVLIKATIATILFFIVKKILNIF